MEGERIDWRVVDKQHAVELQQLEEEHQSVCHNEARADESGSVEQHDTGSEE